MALKNSKANIVSPKSPPNNGSQEDVCSICLDVPTAISSLDSCKHYYCYRCIYQWSKQSNTCPLCKARFHSITKIEEQNNSHKRKRESSNDKGRKKSKRDGVTSVPHRDMQAGPHIPFAAPVAMIQLLLSHMSGAAFFGGARPAPRRQFRELPGGVIDLTDEVDSDNDSDSDDYDPEGIPPQRRRDFIRERDHGEGRVELEIVDSDEEGDNNNINNNNNNNNNNDSDTDDFRLNRIVPNERDNNQGNNNIVIDLSD